MSKEKKNTQNEKRKLSRQERKQIDTLIRQAKGDGKPHTAQDSIPFERMILSILVDTFFSRISLSMPPIPKSHNTACVLS